MRIVVLGGTGNISTSIVKLLLEKGHEVTCYNRGNHAESSKDVRVILGDRRDRETFEKTMQKESFDVAIDMISFTKEDAASSLAAFRGVKQFIQCSTVCTYGVDYDWLPVSEDHRVRPITDYGRGKVAADQLLLESYYREGFPVTIIKPSTTYGPQMGLLRQVAWDFSWLDRIRKGKPIIISGDGKAIHSFLHVDDAAMGFVGVIGKDHCIGQTYNLVDQGFVTWEEHHRTAMKVLNRNVELVGVSLQTLLALNEERFSFCKEISVHNVYYSSAKIFRDVPEFKPAISLEEGMCRVIEEMDRRGTIPDSDKESWEDAIIEAQRQAFGSLRI
ncbi:NAD-dependent epimerase/dehydratase family protein [Paenibacillus frigoriresistens]|uniref:NAD-dependent epimerase/dehydratase family protein n=1 Tax=Paenibacillus alginolyticus TaxID=59839 RepID=UPI0015655FD7|nr:NAD-dependent epimerase/dehydratase family protein [Paenibacillus frigoriresistens]NRF90380.1 NAD-dependent epimerase/dehydratase family protein [Paenibacillus frigoriresistens]